jgi:hypothetical protein
MPEDFDQWMKNHYTKVLMESIRYDYAPRALLQDALTALEYHQAQTRPIESTIVTIAALRQALAGWGTSSTNTTEHQQAQRDRNAEALQWAVKTLRFLMPGTPVGPHAAFEEAVAALGVAECPVCSARPREPHHSACSGGKLAKAIAADAGVAIPAKGDDRG